jgi:hypothetical protein
MGWEARVMSSKNEAKRSPRWRFVARTLTWLLLSSLLSSCGIFGLRLQSPITVLHDESRMGPERLTSAEIQSEVMTYADTFGAIVNEVWNNVLRGLRLEALPLDPAAIATDPLELDRALEQVKRAERISVHQKLAAVRASILIASSPNPAVALADMMTMVTLQRTVMERRRMAALYGINGQKTLVEAFREQERRIWAIGERAMSAKQLEELRQMIKAWVAANPNVNYVAGVRLEDFARARQKSQVQGEGSSGSLLSLVALDPLAGLDPAQRDLQKTRLLAERMFFYASRVPQLLTWRFENGLPEAARGARDRGASRLDAAHGRRRATRHCCRGEAARGHCRRARSPIAAVLRGAERGAPSDAAAVLRGVCARSGRRSCASWTPSSPTRPRPSPIFARRCSRANRWPLRCNDSWLPALSWLAASCRRLTASPAQAPSSVEPVQLDDYARVIEQTANAADRLSSLVSGIDVLLRPGEDANAKPRLIAATSEVETSSRKLIDSAFGRLLVLIIVAPLMAALAAFLYRWAVRRL